jgi:hypothetical protein
MPSENSNLTHTSYPSGGTVPSNQTPSDVTLTCDASLVILSTTPGNDAATSTHCNIERDLALHDTTGGIVVLHNTLDDNVNVQDGGDLFALLPAPVFDLPEYTDLLNQLNALAQKFTL